MEQFVCSLRVAISGASMRGRSLCAADRRSFLLDAPLFHHRRASSSRLPPHRFRPPALYSSSAAPFFTVFSFRVLYRLSVAAAAAAGAVDDLSPNTATYMGSGGMFSHLPVRDSVVVMAR